MRESATGRKVKTNFNPEMLTDPDVAEAQSILHKCTNCGCCNAACPTYELTGDEREAPRGRINLIREMLESGDAPKPATVQHIDNCLSCLSCTVACPSGVDYMHLVDYARVHIENKHKRPLRERMFRHLLTQVLPHPGRFRTAVTLGRLVKPLAGLLRKTRATNAIGNMLSSIPSRLPPRLEVSPGRGHKPGTAAHRVIIPTGCVQSVLDPQINRSTINLLTRFDVEVVMPEAGACCGALNYHLGKRDAALDQIRANIDAWCQIMDQGTVDAIVITASGCGSTVKDYGHILRDDPVYAEKAGKVSRLAMDVTEFLGKLDLPEPRVKPGLRVAYHAACTLQHGQKLLNEPKKLLRQAGFIVLSPKDEHLCCGSAGTYSMLHTQTAESLRDRKVTALQQTRADVIAGGNIGCLHHIGEASNLPVLHTVTLLEWAWTGTIPTTVARDWSVHDQAKPMAAAAAQS